MTDALRRVFAANLRKHSTRFPTIAHICRGVPVNRQQFNKYLLGHNLPTPRIRQKLCQFLGVSEEEMFTLSSLENRASVTQQERAQVTSQVVGEKPLPPELMRIFGGENSSDYRSSMKAGFYFCYFHLQNFDDFLVRSIVKITHSKAGTTFTRRTYFRSSQYPPRVISRGKHKGVVLESASEISFLGFASSTPHHFSLITFERSNENDEGILLGIALTKGSSTSFASRACLEFVGDRPSQLKARLAEVGVASIDDQSLHPVVRAAMSQEAPHNASQINILDYEQIVAVPRKPTKTTMRPEGLKPFDSAA